MTAIADVMNLLPEVLWDRYVDTTVDGESGVSAYGWIDRPDGRSDFVVLDVSDTGRCGFVTSSARWSREFATRLHGDDADHSDCLRVEDRFGHEVRNCVRLGGAA